MLLLVFSFEFHFDTLLEKWLRPIINEYFFEPFFFLPLNIFFFYHFFLSILIFNFIPPSYFLILSSFQLPKMAPKFLRGDLRTTIFRRIDLQTLIRTIPKPNHTRILVFDEDAIRRILRREESRLVIRARNSSTYVFWTIDSRLTFDSTCTSSFHLQLRKIERVGRK